MTLWMVDMDSDFMPQGGVTVEYTNRSKEESNPAPPKVNAVRASVLREQRRRKSSGEKPDRPLDFRRRLGDSKQ